MKRKVLKSINILGHKWTIDYVDEEKLPPGAAGLCIFQDRKIFILKNGMNAMITRMTLLHEARHAMQFESGLTNVLDNQALEMDADGFASFVMSIKKQGFI